MSTATELAELDAAIAENELTADEAESLREGVAAGVNIAAALEQVLADRSPVPEAETPPPPPPTEPTDKQWRELGKENERHEAAVHRIMGEFVAGFETCDGCGGSGLTPPGPPAPAPKPHEWFKTCDTCNGFGQVLTGSLRAGNEARDCPTCLGRGYLEALDEQGAPLAGANGAQSPPVELSPVPNGAGAVAPAAGDRFGVPSWMGDPNLGR
jgi:hypothetical protein